MRRSASVSAVWPPIEVMMKSAMMRPKPEHEPKRKWKAIIVMRPLLGDWKRKETNDESGSVAQPKRASRAAPMRVLRRGSRRQRRRVMPCRSWRFVVVGGGGGGAAAAFGAPR